jgi:hypothetical protein
MKSIPKTRFAGKVKDRKIDVYPQGTVRFSRKINTERSGPRSDKNQ